MDVMDSLVDPGCGLKSNERMGFRNFQAVSSENVFSKLVVVKILGYLWWEIVKLCTYDQRYSTMLRIYSIPYSSRHLLGTSI